MERTCSLITQGCAGVGTGGGLDNSVLLNNSVVGWGGGLDNSVFHVPLGWKGRAPHSSLCSACCQEEWGGLEGLIIARPTHAPHREGRGGGGREGFDNSVSSTRCPTTRDRSPLRLSPEPPVKKGCLDTLNVKTL